MNSFLYVFSYSGAHCCSGMCSDFKKRKLSEYKCRKLLDNSFRQLTIYYRTCRSLVRQSHYQRFFPNLDKPRLISTPTALTTTNHRTSTFMKVLIALTCLIFACFAVAQPTAPQLSDFPQIKDLPSCLGRDKVVGYESRKPILVASNPWSGSAVNAYIAKILLEEVAGIPASIIEIDEFSQWEFIASGQIHACLEVWPSGHVENKERYILTDKTVTSAGPLGVIGQIGWYVPRYTVTNAPLIATGNIDQATADYFNNTFTLGDPTWATFDQDIITTNGWDLQISYLTGEQSLMDLIAAKNRTQQPILFYFWTPHAVHKIFDLVRVQLPDNDAFYPAEILGKIVATSLREYNKEANFFFSSLSYDSATQISLLADMYRGRDAYNVSCEWIRANENVWTNWILITPFEFISDGVIIAAHVIAFAGIGVGIFFVIMMLLRRDSQIVRASSPKFLLVMLFGCFLLYAAVVAYNFLSEIGCNIWLWFFNVGFVLLFGTLFAKTFRIYRIFSNKKLKPVKFTDKDVGIVLAVLVGIEVGLLIAMTAWQRPTYGLAEFDTVQYNSCKFNFEIGIALIIYKGILLVMGVVISVLTRKVNMSMYNESKYIGLAIYNMCLAVIFIVVMFLIDALTAKFIIQQFATLFLTSTTMCIFFAPKVRTLLKYNDMEIMQKYTEERAKSWQSRVGKQPSATPDYNSSNKPSTGQKPSTKDSGSFPSSLVEDKMDFKVTSVVSPDLNQPVPATSMKSSVHPGESTESSESPKPIIQDVDRSSSEESSSSSSS